jgi:hypothetical protein
MSNRPRSGQSGRGPPSCKPIGQRRPPRRHRELAQSTFGPGRGALDPNHDIRISEVTGEESSAGILGSRHQFCCTQDGRLGDHIGRITELGRQGLVEVSDPPTRSAIAARADGQRIVRCAAAIELRAPARGRRRLGGDGVIDHSNVSESGAARADHGEEVGQEKAVERVSLVFESFTGHRALGGLGGRCTGTLF